MKRTMLRTVGDLWRDESGVASVEYALLLSLIVIGVVGAWTRFATHLVAVVESSANAFEALPVR